MQLTKEEQKRLNKLPFGLKILANTLIDGLNRILNNSCSEEEVLQSAHTFSKLNSGYKRAEDYVTLDAASKILGLNRNQTNDLIKRAGIKSEKINNRSVGYSRERIIALKSVII